MSPEGTMIGLATASTMVVCIVAALLTTTTDHHPNPTNPKKQRKTSTPTTPRRGGIPNTGNSCYINSAIQFLAPFKLAIVQRETNTPNPFLIAQVMFQIRQHIATTTEHMEAILQLYKPEFAKLKDRPMGDAREVVAHLLNMFRADDSLALVNHLDHLDNEEKGKGVAYEIQGVGEKQRTYVFDELSYPRQMHVVDYFDENVKMELLAVIMLRNQHYYTMAKHDGVWYEANDRIFRRLKGGPFDHPNDQKTVVMLGYERHVDVVQ